MKVYLPKFLVLLAILGICCLPAFGQVSTTGSIAGTVTDAQGAVVPNVTVTSKNKATGKEATAQTNESGNFKIPVVEAPGVYNVTVKAQSGFKTAQVTDVKVDVATPATVNVVLEVGSAEETVTIIGGGEVLQTQTATVGTTLTGRQITDIPTASRDALDLVLGLPGTTTVGRPRQSSVNGLPKGALNITIDGINVQDNLLKSNDGFFTYIRPRTDAISEVTTSTSNPGAESSGEGAYQIKFTTEGGGNQYHGGGYYYYRTPGLNANYWFNNRDLPADPLTGKAPRTPIILNQPGFKIGGPISIPKVFNGKDRAFFFFNYEEFRLPESTLRTRTVMSPQAQSGLYRFFNATNVSGSALNTTCAAAPSGSPAAFLCSTDVLARAAAAGGGLLSTVDPTIGPLLASIRSSLTSATIKDTGDPNLQTAAFINKGGQKREFPTVRFDFNLTKKHHLENIWNYQNFGGVVDFLNNVDPAFPGFPNHGAQTSVRFSNSTGWRWTVTNNIVNEARYGIVGGTTLFFAEVNSGQFTNQAANGQAMSQGLTNFGAIQNATVTTGPQRRNSPVREFADNLSWTKGNHSFNFGATATRIAFWQQLQTVVPTTVFTTSNTLDPTPFNAFSTLPSSQQNGAAQLLNVLTGRLTAFNSNARLDENSNNYSWLGSLISRAHSLEWGAFGQDSWRFRPNITLTFGLRYERQQAIQADNSTYAGVTYADLFGESGANNLFQPGTLTGNHSAYFNFAPGTKAYNDTGIFLPSFGFTYSPNWKAGVLHHLIGESGETVIRGGFSMASVREGTQVFQSIVGANPGGTLTTNRSLTLNNLPVGTYLRNAAPLAPAAFPTSPVYPNFGLLTDSVNAFDPNLKIGYVESWSFGIQREFKKDNVFEVRYTGNRGHKLWRQMDLNEVNIVENGIYNELVLAQQNLVANMANGRGANFKYFGPGTSTTPLPILFGYFQAVQPTLANASNCTNVATCGALYSSGNWSSTTFTNPLNPLGAQPLLFANGLSSTSFENRRTPLGQACFGLTGCTGLGLFPYNQLTVNPGKRGSPFVVNNTGESWYDAFTFEFRRRMSKGLLIQGSYTFGKALSNTFASSSAVFDQPATLRNLWLKKGVTNFDIRHGFKTNFIYELPFGKGKSFMSSANGIVDRVVGGWAFNGNLRYQSGIPFNFAAPNGLFDYGGTIQQNTGNFQLVGMTVKDLQKAVGVYRDPDGFIYLLPKDIRDNTVRAFNISLTSTGPSYTQGAPSGRYIAPAGLGCMQRFIGDCGFANLILHGPGFFRSDLSIAKRIRFTESANLELRLEMLNAFNNINFQPGAAANDVNTLGSLTSSAFGRMTAAYQDLSTTSDPGGRVGQIVVRINF
ncbi:MAG TPA: TonB-dependent receptor [Pyrinomonadaceae bacterium]|nr:TonB-dependent receptor [Pyrinomonadaceae bacterium]